MHRSRIARGFVRSLLTRSRVVATLALLFTSACASHTTAATAGANREPTRAHPYVIVVSLDAFRHDYIDRYRMTTLQELAARGVRADGLVPPFPSKTFPSHYSIATGLYPGHHGIVGNSFFDPALGRWFRVKDTAAVRDGSWYGGEPIWVTAEREGVHAATFFWPGSEGAVKGVRPTHWLRYRASVPDSSRVDACIAWLRGDARDRPHLVMLYLTDVDDSAHKRGPDAPAVALAAASLERTLRRLMDSVRALPMHDSVNLIVLSDHGMSSTPKDHILPIRPLLAARGIDTTRVTFGDNGPTMSLWFNGDDALQRRTMAALEQGLVHARAYDLASAPARWHLAGNRRAGDAIVVGELGYVVTRSETDTLIDLGTHGWDPAEREMHGIFVAAGPQVRHVAGTVAAFDNVNVYPFLAALLQLRYAPRTDGDFGVLQPFLRVGQ